MAAVFDVQRFSTAFAGFAGPCLADWDHQQVAAFACGEADAILEPAMHGVEIVVGELYRAIEISVPAGPRLIDDGDGTGGAGFVGELFHGGEHFLFPPPGQRGHAAQFLEHDDVPVSFADFAEGGFVCGVLGEGPSANGGLSYADVLSMGAALPAEDAWHRDAVAVSNKKDGGFLLAADAGDGFRALFGRFDTEGGWCEC